MIKPLQAPPPTGTPDRAAPRTGIGTVRIGAFAWILALILGVLLPSLAAEGRAAPARRTLLVLGDSLAAGYGLDPTQAYPALLQQHVDRAGLPYEVVNAGVSGETTAGGLRRLNWLLKRKVDVLLVALGGNDGLRGLAPAATRSNLLSIISVARSRYPDLRVILAGMQMPPNLGADYTREFQAVFPAVARETQSTIIPHLLEGVGGKPELNQPDLIHPTPRGHELVASNVWTMLEPLLRKSAPAPPLR